MIDQQRKEADAQFTKILPIKIRKVWSAVAFIVKTVTIKTDFGVQPDHAERFPHEDSVLKDRSFKIIPLLSSTESNKCFISRFLQNLMTCHSSQLCSRMNGYKTSRTLAH